MTDPYVLARALLTRVAAQFAAANVALPEQQYLAPGDSQTIAYDGPAMMINVDFLSQGQPGADRTQTPTYPHMQVLHYVQLSVTILRDVATSDDDGNPPSVALIEADAKTSMADLVTLQSALEVVAAQDDWVPPGAPVVLGRVVPVGPQGGVAAVVGQIQVGLL